MHLYKDTPLPQEPISHKTPKKSERNQVIRERYNNGETIADIARDYKLSEQRIHQIVNFKRK